MSHHVSTSLVGVLSPAQLDSVLASTSNIGLLDPVLREATRKVFGQAINMQFRIITGFSSAAFGAALFCFRLKPVDLNAMAARRMAMMKNGGVPPPSDSAGAENTSDSQDAGAQQQQQQHCCSEDCKSQHANGWDAESQTWEGDEKHWEREEQEAAFYQSKWDTGAQSEVWTLTNHPIPQGHLFKPAELSCPRCGYSMLDKIR